MNILILTNIYPAPDLEQENTPVVHYFVREWIKMGVGVRVVHYPANFPKLMMWGASFFKSYLSSKMGATIRTKQVAEKEYELDNVKVKRIPWVNPQLEIMARLKEHFHAGTCYVAHTPTSEFTSIFDTQKIQELLANIDKVGFRSAYIRDKFVSAFGYSGPTFQCYSGIPEQYIPTESVERNFTDVNRFVFVGTLIKRKYPAEIILSVVKAFGTDFFEINYIGKGAEHKAIVENARRLGVSDKVHLLGRMSRDEVVAHLQQSDVFVMNSRSEAFGLVYLEAMAQGCLTIASRKEGFDGIIIDGENGFLCNAGDVDDLAATIQRIRTMSPEQRKRISENAVLTARGLTDTKAATFYLEELKRIM